MHCIYEQVPKSTTGSALQNFQISEMGPLFALKDVLSATGNKSLSNDTIAAILKSAGGNARMGKQSLADVLRNKSFIESVKKNPYLNEKAL